ncbi:MAG: tetratricopeptide repeat protein [Verrucomicrobia bacterium]|nr:tetratricopeptide repeat protein [Verrucomicrobiota bacterium]
MIKLTHQFATVALASLLVVFTAPAAESLSVLLQKGIYAEETEGNLDAAIKIYEGIVKEGEANRSLVAQAQYRLGVCQMKRGKTEDAAVAFRMLIDRFSDAAELVAKSRERLVELGQPTAATTVRQIWSSARTLGDSVSMDGRYLSFVDLMSGNVAVRDLLVGQNRLLTNNPTAGTDGFPEQCVLSRDGKRIAYNWVHYGKETFSSGLLVAGVESGSSRVLLAQETNRWVVVEDWSPDGKWIAAIEARWEQGYMPGNWEGTNSQVSISLVGTANGMVRKLVHLGGISPFSGSNARFSSDGRYLAYNHSRNANARGRVQPTNDIVIVDLETEARRVAVEYVAHENFVGWAPRDTGLLFTSDRSGTTGLWSLELNKVDAKPKLLKADVGDIQPIGLTRDGALFYNIATGPLQETYTASADFAAGKLLDGPKLLRTMLRRTSDGSLGDKFIRSGDGQFLYFRSEDKEPVAFVFDSESGEQREIPNSRTWANRIGWWWIARDHKSLFAALSGQEGEAGMYRIATQTGEIVPFAIPRPGVEQSTTRGPIFFRVYWDFVAYGRYYRETEKFVLVKHELESHRATEYQIPGLAEVRSSVKFRIPRNAGVLMSDGRTFFFNRRKQSEDRYVLVLHDLVTGTDKELLTSKSPVGVVDDEHDPKPIGFLVTTDDRNRPIFSLFTLEGSELRRHNQVTVPEGYEYRGQHWGEPHLILVKPMKPGIGVPSEMWTLSVRTGELKNVGLTVANDQYWGLPGNGKRIVFRTNTPGSREIWVMENFLPPVATAK